MHLPARPARKSQRHGAIRRYPFARFRRAASRRTLMHVAVRAGYSGSSAGSRALDVPSLGPAVARLRNGEQADP